MPLDTSKRVLVTGATGFIGTALVRRLLAESMQISAATRRKTALQCPAFEVGEIDSSTDWSCALQGIDTLVHLAAYAHVLDSRRIDHEHMKRVNVEGSANLARQAAKAGIRHFVFISSIGAMAEASDRILTADSRCDPTTAYGKSKRDAESAIKQEAEAYGMNLTTLRPPLVYGLGNPGNMQRLLRLTRSEIPLPLASVKNRRSFIYVENLVDLITACLGNPKAFGKTFLPSDGEDVSTPQLIRAIAHASTSVEEDRRGKTGNGSAARHASHVTHHSLRLFPFPATALKAIGRLPGLGALRKLTSSLYVDSAPIRRDLSWTPPFTMEEGLRRTLVIDYSQLD